MIDVNKLKNFVVSESDRRVKEIWVVKDERGIIKRWTKQVGYLSKGYLRSALKQRIPTFFLKENNMTSDEAIDTLIELGIIELVPLRLEDNGN